MLTVYRKYRSKNFAEIIGQDHVVTVLKQAVKDGHLAHAFLFSGPRGTGKTSMARILAKAVNCLDLQDGEPCNKCSNCKSINKGSFMDLIEIDAASNRGIDEIRDLKNNVGFLPVEGKFKVYIIDEVHMLTEPAFNALLKTLEEPPKQVLFVLATTEPQKLPLTIISRTQRFDFKLADNLSLQIKLKMILYKEEIECSDEALSLIIQAGQGSFRDAETVLEKVLSAIDRNTEKSIDTNKVESILGLVNVEQVKIFIEKILKGDRQGAFIIIDQIYSDGVNLMHFAKRVLDESRNQMIGLVKSGKDNASIKKYMLIIKEVNTASLDMKTSLIPILPLEVAIVNLTDAFGAFKNASADIKNTPKNVSVKDTIYLKKDAVLEVNDKQDVKKVEKNKKDDEVDLVEDVADQNGEECLQILNEKRSEILEAAKKYNHFLTAILSSTVIDLSDSGEVLFKVSSAFHKKRLDNKETKLILKKLFKDICGKNICYKCIIEKASKDKDKKSNTKIVEEFFN